MHGVIAAGGTGSFDLVLWAVLLACGGLLLAAHRLTVPYPILLVVGGAAIGFAIDDGVELAPELVLVIFLPPLLYSAAFFSSLRDLRENVRPIGLLSIGLVTLTTIVVGVVAHHVIGLPWAAAFTLGAVLSPTDPVAATAIASRAGAPRGFVTIVEGESLVNDSTGLIFYRFAVAAAVTGSFSLVEAFGTLLWTAAAGVAIGVAVGVVVAAIRRRVEDPPTEITLSLLTPYFAYLPAEALGASAVLAAVTAGVWLGWRAPVLISSTTRIQAYAFWEILVFVLNAALFVLVGLQLPAILERIADAYTVGELALYGLVVSLAVVLTRMAFVFPMTYGAALLPGRRPGEHAPHPSQTLLVGFTGMRGAVSLAAALAIPETIDAGTPFPARDLIVFLVYVVILFTVVLQGLLLAPLIRRVGVRDDGAESAREDQARLRAAKAALRRLDELEAEDWTNERSVRRMRALYEFRVRRFEARFDEDDDGSIEEGSQAWQRMRRATLEAEHAEVVRLRNAGGIGDEVMRRIERDLDLEAERLDA